MHIALLILLVVVGFALICLVYGFALNKLLEWWDNRQFQARVGPIFDHFEELTRLDVD